MRSSLASAHTLPIVVLVATGCASNAPPAPPEVPANLRAPAGQVMFLEALGSGVQIYECSPKADQPSVYEWAFRAPEASLADRQGRPLGKHYAGPTWQSTDGSSSGRRGQGSRSRPGSDRHSMAAAQCQGNRRRRRVRRNEEHPANPDNGGTCPHPALQRRQCQAVGARAVHGKLLLLSRRPVDSREWPSSGLLKSSSPMQMPVPQP